jgi:hypothetical protein
MAEYKDFRDVSVVANAFKLKQCDIVLNNKFNTTKENTPAASNGAQYSEINIKPAKDIKNNPITETFKLKVKVKDLVISTSKPAEKSTFKNNSQITISSNQQSQSGKDFVFLLEMLEGKGSKELPELANQLGVSNTKINKIFQRELSKKNIEHKGEKLSEALFRLRIYPHDPKSDSKRKTIFKNFAIVDGKIPDLMYRDEKGNDVAVDKTNYFKVLTHNSVIKAAYIDISAVSWTSNGISILLNTVYVLVKKSLGLEENASNADVIMDEEQIKEVEQLNSESSNMTAELKLAQEQNKSSINPTPVNSTPINTEPIKTKAAVNIKNKTLEPTEEELKNIS